MAFNKTRPCACGHNHIVEPGFTQYKFRDRHEEPTAVTYVDFRDRPPQAPQQKCACDGFVAADKFTKFQIAQQKHLAKLNTPQEQAKIARELARLAEERQRIKPLREVLAKFCDPPKWISAPPKTRKPRASRGTTPPAGSASQQR